MSKKMTRLLARIFLAGLAGLVVGCNLPSRQIDAPTPTIDPVATQVSQLLTAMPTPTLEQEPPAVITATPEPLFTAAPATETVEPNPGDQPSPTSAATATATTNPGDPKANLGAPFWSDNLDTSQSFSYLYENEGTRVSHEPGALILTGRLANGWMGWTLTFKQKPADFYMEAVFITAACSEADMYGLVFRAPDTDSGYFYGVTCDGRYNLHAQDFTDGSDNALINLTANSAILSGSNATNRIGVMAKGDRISLYANGTLLQEVIDDTYTGEGSFGPFVAANNTVDFTARLDEISLWNLP